MTWAQAPLQVVAGATDELSKSVKPTPVKENEADDDYDAQLTNPMTPDDASQGETIEYDVADDDHA